MLRPPRGTGVAAPDLAGVSVRELKLLLGDGAGDFGPTLTRSLALGPALDSPVTLRDLSFGDLDGDGAPDAFVLDPPANELVVRRGRGNGSFLPAVAYSSGTESQTIALGDLDGNGLPEVFISGAAVGFFVQNPAVRVLEDVLRD